MEGEKQPDGALRLKSKASFRLKGNPFSNGGSGSLMRSTLPSATKQFDPLFASVDDCPAYQRAYAPNFRSKDVRAELEPELPQYDVSVTHQANARSLPPLPEFHELRDMPHHSHVKGLTVGQISRHQKSLNAWRMRGYEEVPRWNRREFRKTRRSMKPKPTKTPKTTADEGAKESDKTQDAVGDDDEVGNQHGAEDEEEMIGAEGNVDSARMYPKEMEAWLRA
ncbi:uncharacterized protein J3D65DRAFT_37676 [Phyllosticta citribraziliensis]|uniref:Uncharacterized protein n=1 Tax=Phyllosticta citribraziliensis TaxID=989973 RepID=A0ABR1MAA1_9PEZI